MLFRKLFSTGFVDVLPGTSPRNNYSFFPFYSQLIHGMRASDGDDLVPKANVSYHTHRNNTPKMFTKLNKMDLFNGVALVRHQLFDSIFIEQLFVAKLKLFRITNSQHHRISCIAIVRETEKSRQEVRKLFLFLNFCCFFCLSTIEPSSTDTPKTINKDVKKSRKKKK